MIHFLHYGGRVRLAIVTFGEVFVTHPHILCVYIYIYKHILYKHMQERNDQCHSGTAQADVNKTLPDSGCTTLHMACRKGNQSAFAAFLVVPFQ